MEERHLSLSEAADALNISERTAYRWIKSGKLRAYKPGRDYWIPESAIREVVEASAVRPKAKAPSSQEKLFNNGLEERRLSRLSEAIIAAAARWRDAMSNPDMNDTKRFGLIDAALDLSDAIEKRAREEDWEAISNRERREIVATMEKLVEAANRGLLHLEESGQAKSQEEQVRERREQVRELTRRIGA